MATKTKLNNVRSYTRARLETKIGQEAIRRSKPLAVAFERACR